MYWRTSLGFSIFASALALGAAAHQARAAEAFLCGPDKVVYVEANDLELKKRTDPCIAAYYGLAVSAQTPVAKAEQAPAAPKAATVAKRSPAPELKRHHDTEIATTVATPVVRQAALASPTMASSGADFRNIKVINAASPDDAWFRHQK